MTTHEHMNPVPPPGQPNGRGSQRRSEYRPPGFWRSRAGLVAIGFLVISAFLLLSEHRAHALGFLPFLFLLACPVMHVFMHGGHGGHGNHGGHGRADGGSDRSKTSSGGT